METEYRHRRSIRLQGYDYTQAGAYFVTVCTHERQCLFGNIDEGEMQLSAWGQSVQAEWLRTAVLRPYIELDAFVIMPNHFHGILVIVGEGAAQQNATQKDMSPSDMKTTNAKLTDTTRRVPTREFAKPIAHSLATIIGAFKASVTRQINQQSGEATRLWQPNYYEHIIRDEKDLNRIRQYVIENPALWNKDSLYVE